MSNASTSTICINNIEDGTNHLFSLLDYNQLWYPDQLLKFTIAYNSMLENVNLAYAYCQFSQIYYVISSMFTGMEWFWLPNVLEESGAATITINENGVTVNSPRVGLIESIIRKKWSFVAFGRMVSRFGATFYSEFFPNLNCVV